MTQHDDSMRLLHILRSNPSKTLPRPLGLTERPAPSNASDSPIICNSHRRRRQRLAQVTMRSNCTTSRKVCSMRLARTYLRANCSNMDRNTNRKNRDSNRNNTNSMEPVSCMACNSKVNSLRKQPMSRYQHSDSRGLELLLRHCPRSSGNLRMHNTTSLDKAYPLAHRLPSSRRLKSPLNTRSRAHTRNLVLQHSNHTQCSIPRSPLRTQRTASRRSIPRQPNRSNRQNRSIKLSAATRHQLERSSHELGKAI